MSITRDELLSWKYRLADHPEQDDVDDKIERIIEADELYRIWKANFPHDSESHMGRYEFISSITGYPPRTISRHLRTQDLTRNKRDFAHKLEREYKESLRSKISRMIDCDVEIKGSKLIIRLKDGDLGYLADVIEKGIDAFK